MYLVDSSEPLNQQYLYEFLSDKINIGYIGERFDELRSKCI